MDAVLRALLGPCPAEIGILDLTSLACSSSGLVPRIVI
jgi:hypothetical protein